MQIAVQFQTQQRVGAHHGMQPFTLMNSKWLGQGESNIALLHHVINNISNAVVESVSSPSSEKH